MHGYIGVGWISARHTCKGLFFYWVDFSLAWFCILCV
jgi:hypothetical protein